MALTPMSKQEFLEACEAHALGALDAVDRDRFQIALPSADTEMKDALDEALHTAELLSLAMVSAAPSPGVRDRLFARIRAEHGTELTLAAPPRPAPRHFVLDEPQPSPTRSLWDRLFGEAPAWNTPARVAFVSALALVFVAAGLGLYTRALSHKLTAQQVALQGTHQAMDALADSTRTRITSLQDSLSRQQAMLEVIRAKGMQMIALNGMQDTSRYGKIIWDPERRMAVLQVSLPPEPEGMSYQLWVIRDHKPMDAGVFQVSAVSGDGLYRIEQLVETDKKHITAFAVTMEPKGGMPQPTGKMYLMGQNPLGPI